MVFQTLSDGPFVTIILLFLAYFSMLFSAAKLETEQQIQVLKLLTILKNKVSNAKLGFSVGRRIAQTTIGLTL
jgi:hypothetical protein